MNINPKTEEQIAEEGLLQPGIYPFTTVHAEEKFSQAGNEMIVLTLRVFSGTDEKLVYDYLVDAKFPRKVRHYCDCVGILDTYNSGSLGPDHCVGRSGYLILEIQPGSSKGPTKNSVKDYRKQEDHLGADAPAAVQSDVGAGLVKQVPFDDDDIPF